MLPDKRDPAKPDNRGRFLGVILLAFLGLACFGCSHTVEPPDDILRFGYVGGGTRKNTPPGAIGWAFERGIMQKALAGIGLTKVEFISAGGPTFNPMFAAGAVDVFTTGDTPGIIGHGAGLDIKFINMADVGLDNYLITRANGPRTLKELAGRKIASGMVGDTWRYVQGLIYEENLVGKTELVNLSAGGDASEAALRSGSVDAIVVSFGPLYEKRGFRILDESQKHPLLVGSDITVGGTDFLRRHPRFAGVWNDAIARAIIDIRAHPDEFYKFWASTSKLPEWALRRMYPISILSTDPLPPRGAELVEQTKQFLLKYRFIREDFSLKGWLAPGIYYGLAQPSVQKPTTPAHASAI